VGKMREKVVMEYFKIMERQKKTTEFLRRDIQSLDQDSESILSTAHTFCNEWL
jgi:hypothetical protein